MANMTLKVTVGSFSCDYVFVCVFGQRGSSAGQFLMDEVPQSRFLLLLRLSGSQAQLINA